MGITSLVSTRCWLQITFIAPLLFPPTPFFFYRWHKTFVIKPKTVRPLSIVQTTSLLLSLPFTNRRRRIRSVHRLIGNVTILYNSTDQYSDIIIAGLDQTRLVLDSLFLDLHDTDDRGGTPLLAAGYRSRPVLLLADSGEWTKVEEIVASSAAIFTLFINININIIID
jgi:hypothetical protein